MIEWTGNLNDDCKAEWQGIRMHAEKMDKNIWWWAIYNSNQEIIDTSNEYKEFFENGKLARKAAEKAAKKGKKKAPVRQVEEKGSLL